MGKDESNEGQGDQSALEAQEHGERKGLIRDQQETVKIETNHSSAMIKGFTANLPKLNGKNYSSWKSMLTTYLELNDLYDTVFGSDDVVVEKYTELRARLVIQETLDEKHRMQTQNCKTSKEIIRRLTKTYAEATRANLSTILQKYYTFKKAPEDDMSSHLAKLEVMRSELAELGQEQTDDMFIYRILETLPKEYELLKMMWDNAPTELQTVPEIQSRILRQERKLRDTAEATRITEALMVSKPSTDKSQKYKSIQERKKHTHCAKCGYKGHWARECKTKPENYAKKPDSDDTKGQASQEKEISRKSVFTVTKSVPMQENHWFADSAATQHMCNKANWFTSLRYFNEPEECSLGNGSKIKVLGEGTVDLISHLGDREAQVTLQDVLYIPELSTNLLSIGIATEHGVKTIFCDDQCNLYQGDSKVATGKRYGRSLYLMTMVAAKAENHRALLCQGERTISEWHKTLGHVSNKRIEALAKDPALGISITKKQAELDCADCPAGKGKHSSHPLSTTNRATVPGERVHVDLSGIINPAAISGAKYYLLCKDECTTYTYGYLLREKSSVNLALAQMLIEFETDSGYRVKRLQSDNGSEFVNQQTKILFAKEHVVHETVAPYTPQQNGRIEREIQSITNMARTMLYSAKVPIELWDEAIRTAVYLRNRLPNKSTQRTPFELFMQRKPSLKHLVSFGTEAHVVISGHHLTKFEPRTEPGHVVGFTARSNTYRVYLCQSKRVLESSDVIFKPHGSYSCETAKTDSRSSDTVRQDATVHVQGSDSQTGRENSGKKKGCVGSAVLNEFFDAYVNPVGKESTRLSETAKSDAVPPPTLSTIDLTKPERDPDENLLENMNESEFDRLPEAPTLETIAESSEIEQEQAFDELDIDQGSCAVMMVTSDEPRSYKEAMSSKDSDNWSQAVREELDAHKRNGTWSIATKPNNKAILTTKWVFKIKRKLDGATERYKARLVVRGFEQVAGLDFHETYAPVARYESIRILIALAAHYEMTYIQFDVKTAFLYGILAEEVYIQIPEGLDLSNDHALKLNKGLYGLKQAPRVWNNKFTETIEKLGFKPTYADNCVFHNPHSRLYLCIYVDDGLIFGPNATTLETPIRYLKEHFDIRVVTGTAFIGMEIMPIERGFFVHQQHYAKEILERFQMSNCAPVSAPLETGHQLTMISETDKDLDCPYREAIGALQFLAGNTRPDLLHCVALLAKFSACPKEKHWAAIKRVLRYLRGTLSLGIKFEKENKLKPIAYTDADWASDATNRKSISGSLILMSNGPIIFRSAQQQLVALSTTEAEFIAAADTVKELIWMRTMLKELRVDHERAELRCDSQTAIRLIKNPEFHRRTKHIDIKYHFIREHWNNETFTILYVSTDEQLADYLTKAVPRKRFAELLSKSNICAV